jgi:inhibitor of KinA
VRQVVDALSRDRPGWLIDLIPSERGVLVVLDPLNAGVRDARGALHDIVDRATDTPQAPPAREIVIPVCYDVSLAIDLGQIARDAGATPEGIAKLHASVIYDAVAVGFAPGFAYLAGTPDAISLPRRGEPRARVPAGAVAVAGMYTGVYPHASPGGWHIIGRTPARMFDPGREPPALIRVGDRVRFEPITRDGYDRLMSASERQA